jgi:vacuolar-type H+-ATPase subunit H
MNEQLAAIDFTAVTAALKNVTLPEGITLPDLSGAVTYETFCDLKSAQKDAESALFNQIRENSKETKADAKQNGKGEHGKSETDAEDNEELGKNNEKKMKDYLESVRDEADKEWKGRKNGGN